MDLKFYFVLLVTYFSIGEAIEATDPISAIVGLKFTRGYEISCMWVDFEFADNAKVLFQNLNQIGSHDELEVYSMWNLTKLALEPPPFLAVLDENDVHYMDGSGYFPEYMINNNVTTILAPKLPIINFFLHQLRSSSFKR